MSFTIGFVCTGNLCRSPAAELLLRAHAPDPNSVAIWSAGTRARPGEPIDPACAAILAELAIDSAAHRSQRLAPARLAHADLVLCAALEHRAAVLALAPRLMRRAFTIKEFGALARQAELPASGAPCTGEEADAARRAIVAAVAERRGSPRQAVDSQAARWSAHGSTADDIADPIGAAPDVVRSVLEEIDAYCTAIAETLGLGTGDVGRRRSTTTRSALSAAAALPTTQDRA